MQLTEIERELIGDSLRWWEEKVKPRHISVVRQVTMEGTKYSKGYAEWLSDPRVKPPKDQETQDYEEAYAYLDELFPGAKV